MDPAPKSNQVSDIVKIINPESDHKKRRAASWNMATELAHIVSAAAHDHRKNIDPP